MSGPAPTDAFRKLAVDVVADAAWGYGDQGERATATIPAALVERLCRLAGFSGVADAERAIEAGS